MDRFPSILRRQQGGGWCYSLQLEGIEEVYVTDA